MCVYVCVRACMRVVHTHRCMGVHTVTHMWKPKTKAKCLPEPGAHILLSLLASEVLDLSVFARSMLQLQALCLYSAS